MSLSESMSICGARTRVGTSCRNHPMKNGRCRLHGGKSRAGREHGRYKHGGCTKEMKAFNLELRKEARELVREFRDIEDLIGRP